MERDAVVIEVALNEAVMRHQAAHVAYTPSGKIKKFVLRAELREKSP